MEVVLVTGGSSGIGAATAMILAQNGMKVYAGSRRGTIAQEHPNIIPVVLDVNDAPCTQKVVNQIVEKEGKLDAVVWRAQNNPGLPACFPQTGPRPYYHCNIGDGCAPASLPGVLFIGQSCHAGPHGRSQDGAQGQRNTVLQRSARRRSHGIHIGQEEIIPGWNSLSREHQAQPCQDRKGRAYRTF